MIKLHGKDYIEVKDRVTAVHADEQAKGFSMLGEETFEMGGRAYVRVIIQVKEKQYIGTAEIKFGANPKTPDGMSPLECGETSALGRALGFAGYGVVESIASADEVMRNLANEPAMPKPRVENAQVPSPRNPVDQLKREALEARFITGKNAEELLKAWKDRLRAVFQRDITDDDLLESEALRATLRAAIERYVKRNAEAATSGK